MRALLLCILLVGCGGGSSPASAPSPVPPSVPIQSRATDFYVYFDGKPHAGYHGGGRWWASKPVGNTVQITWGGSVEHWEVKDCDGEKWVWVYGYSPSPAGPTAAYPIETLKATVTVGGVTRDITRLCNPDDGKPHGGPFMPLEIPQAGTLVLRQWFWTWSNTTARANLGYWEATYTYGVTALNACWQGAAPMTRPVIGMSEYWWDLSGETRGIGTPAYDHAGNPIVPTVSYTWSTQIAANAGVLWDQCLTKVE